MHKNKVCWRLSYNPPGLDYNPWQVYVCLGDAASLCGKFTRLRQGTRCKKSPRVFRAIWTRNLSYEEALNLGNILQDRADTLPGDEIVYAVSDRDSYRRTLELYLKDGVLTQAEQLLLWEERRRLGIANEVHNQLMEQLLAVWIRQGKSVQIHAFKGGMTDV